MKIEEQVLSIEQMKHLQELGVDTSDASMYWVRAKRIIGKQRNNVLDNEMGKWRLSLSKNIVHSVDWAVESVPTYTIGDLIEKLPKSDNSGDLLIEYRNLELGYGVWDWGELYGINAQQNFKDKPLKNALYDLLCWVAENHKELLEVRNEKEYFT